MANLLLGYGINISYTEIQRKPWLIVCLLLWCVERGIWNF